MSLLDNERKILSDVENTYEYIIYKYIDSTEHCIFLSNGLISETGLPARINLERDTLYVCNGYDFIWLGEFHNGWQSIPSTLYIKLMGIITEKMKDKMSIDYGFTIR